MHCKWAQSWIAESSAQQKEDREAVLTVKALAARPVTLIFLGLARQQDGAAQKPCAKGNAQCHFGVPEGAAQEQQNQH